MFLDKQGYRLDDNMLMQDKKVSLSWQPMKDSWQENSHDTSTSNIFYMGSSGHRGVAYQTLPHRTNASGFLHKVSARIAILEVL